MRATAPLVLDGQIDETDWQLAPAVTDFAQAEPSPGAPPSAVTEARILYDATHLYIAVRAHDPLPKAITARQLQRDAELDYDDHFTLVLGPFANARDGYLFRINPLGAQQDGLIFDGAELRADWDGLWRAETAVDADGWTAEIAIPFSTLSLDPTIDAWRFNMERRIARDNERIRWRGARAELEVSALQVAGRLSGLNDLRRGYGIRIKPSLSLTPTYDAVSDNLSLKLEPSLDAFYQYSPSSTLAMTLNTDFADTEIDERRVNLTRFPLFFPEKRDFFLQDAGLFEFAGIEESPLPFFSRRIGIDSAGDPVNLNAGIKLTGRSGRYDYGLLTTQVDRSLDAPQKVLSVARAKANLTSTTSLGIIATDGDPARDADSRLYGADARFRTDAFRGKKRTLDIGAWGQQTESEGLADGAAYGVFLDYPNPGWIGNVSFTHIDPGYRPALGFVFETDLRESDGEFGYWKILRSGADIIPQFDWNVRLTSDNRFLSSTLNPEVYLENRYGDYLFPELFIEREHLPEDFEIVPGITIPAGDYEYLRPLVQYGSSQDRAVSVEGYVACCEFYDGTRRDLAVNVLWNPDPGFGFGLGSEFNDLDLPGGEFFVQVYSLAADWRFSHRLTLNNVLQYDNVSDGIGFNSRMRFRFAPGGDLFVVLNHNAEAEDGFRGRDTSLTVKLSYNFLL